MKKCIRSPATLAILVGLLLSCATSRIEDYRPKSTQEKEVLEVFAEMIDARRNQDFEAYMTFFNDNAKIFKRLHPGSNSGSFLPKHKYAASPGEEFSIPPMPTDIQITIGEDIAILKCWNLQREVRSHWTLDMEKENGQWRVIKYDYTPYRR